MPSTATAVKAMRKLRPENQDASELKRLLEARGIRIIETADGNWDLNALITYDPQTGDYSWRGDALSGGLTLLSIEERAELLAGLVLGED